jgi:hypothetical protein
MKRTLPLNIQQIDPENKSRKNQGRIIKNSKLNLQQQKHKRKTTTYAKELPHPTRLLER